MTNEDVRVLRFIVTTVVGSTVHRYQVRRSLLNEDRDALKRAARAIKRAVSGQSKRLYLNHPVAWYRAEMLVSVRAEEEEKEEDAGRQSPTMGFVLSAHDDYEED